MPDPRPLLQGKMGDVLVGQPRERLDDQGELGVVSEHRLASVDGNARVRAGRDLPQPRPKVSRRFHSLRGVEGALFDDARRIP